MDLLERELYLRDAGLLLDAAAAGQGRCVFVGGEAGVGKTMFVQQVCARATDSARVLLGACDPLSTPRPLGPLADIAAVVGGPLAAALDRLAPRDTLFRAFLTELSGARPTLLVFEDVHWADEATLDLLRFVARRLDQTRALLLATYRDDELGPLHPLRVVLGDLATLPAVQRMLLPPLTVAAVAQLAHHSAFDPAALHRLTGGNPFFITEILAAGVAGLPPSVRDAVLARVARLSAQSCATLDVAAVIGARVEPRLLDDIAGPDAAGVDECVARGVLRSDGAQLAFRHELARMAVLDAIAAPRRARLHAAVLAALEARDAGPDALASLAHHAEAAGNRAAVLRYAPAAGRRAAGLLAHREAAAQYARALRFADELAPELRAGLLEARAYECYLTQQIDDAIAARTEALAIWRRTHDRINEGNTLRWLSRLNWFRGHNAQAEAAGRAALDVLEPAGPSRQLAMAYSNLAQLRMLSQHNAEAIVWGTKAIELAQTLNDVEILSHALNNVGTAMVQDGDDRGMETLHRSLDLALDAGLEEHVARAYTNLASATAQQIQLARADGYLDAGITYCVEHDLDSWVLYMLSWHAVVRLLQGRWNEATTMAATVVDHPSRAAVSRIQALVVLGRVRARRGDPEVAAVLDEALALAASTGELQRLVPVRAARAEAAWLANDNAGLRSEARAGLDLAARDANPWQLGELSLWLWRAGELGEAPAGAASPFAVWIAGRAAQAADEWERLGCPYEAASARADAGDVANLQRALEAFGALDARPAAQLAARRLRRLGLRGLRRGPRAATRANPAQLTARESEIAQLIAAGLRNAEIADRLYLSPRTVDHHVSAILGKLGARTRTDVARQLQRHGLANIGNDEAKHRQNS